MNTRLVSLINMLCTLTPCSLGQAATDALLKVARNVLECDFHPFESVAKDFQRNARAAGNFYGISPTVKAIALREMMESDFPDYRSRKWIPVAGDGCGNHYVFHMGRRCSDTVCGYDVLS